MYQLTAKDLDDEVDDENPAIRAAGNPNSAVLEALLAYYKSRSKEISLSKIQLKEIARCSPSATIALYAQFRSPIKAAINYSVRYMRGRDHADNCNSHANCDKRSLVLANARKRGIVYPTCPLTEAELDERRQGFPVFWSEPNIPGQILRMMRASTALEDAAGYGRQEFLDLLRSAGADESAWLQSQSEPESESNTPNLWNFDENAPISILSTSSPVHEALTRGQQMMLRHLLSTCGYSPNYRPRAVPTMALPPLSHILVRCDLNNENIQNCLVDLLTHPQLHPNLRTPIFGIHPLHFATAHHNPELLTWLAGFIPGGFAAASTTALGHTLLHIASLPLDAGQIVAQNPNVTTSIHCARTLDYKYKSWRLRNPQPLTLPQQQAQLATIRVLTQAHAEAGKGEGGFNIDVKAKDVDGNTALHYLAGTLNMAEETIDLVRGIEGGEEVWRQAKNHWGLTPSQLWGE